MRSQAAFWGRRAERRASAVHRAALLTLPLFVAPASADDFVTSSGLLPDNAF